MIHFNLKQTTIDHDLKGVNQNYLWARKNDDVKLNSAARISKAHKQISNRGNACVVLQHNAGAKLECTRSSESEQLELAQRSQIKSRSLREQKAQKRSSSVACPWFHSRKTNSFIRVPWCNRVRIKHVRVIFSGCYVCMRPEVSPQVKVQRRAPLNWDSHSFVSNEWERVQLLNKRERLSAVALAFICIEFWMKKSSNERRAADIFFWQRFFYWKIGG